MKTNQDKIRLLAINDPAVNQMLAAYDLGYYVSWEDFLTDLCLGLANIKNALHEHIAKQAELKGPHPIVLNVNSKQKEDILTQLKR